MLRRCRRCVEDGTRRARAHCRQRRWRRRARCRLSPRAACAAVHAGMTALAAVDPPAALDRDRRADRGGRIPGRRTDRPRTVPRCQRHPRPARVRLRRPEHARLPAPRETGTLPAPRETENLPAPCETGTLPAPREKTRAPGRDRRGTREAALQRFSPGQPARQRNRREPPRPRQASVRGRLLASGTKRSSNRTRRQAARCARAWRVARRRGAR